MNNMLKKCKHSNCAVCKKIEERGIFSSILEKMYPEVLLCEHAMYKITNFNDGEFILPTLEFVCEGKQGYYVVDIYSSRYIYLNKDNFTGLWFPDLEHSFNYIVPKYRRKT